MFSREVIYYFGAESVLVPESQLRLANRCLATASSKAKQKPKVLIHVYVLQRGRQANSGFYISDEHICSESRLVPSLFHKKWRRRRGYLSPSWYCSAFDLVSLLLRFCHRKHARN